MVDLIPQKLPPLQLDIFTYPHDHSDTAMLQWNLHLMFRVSISNKSPSQWNVHADQLEVRNPLRCTTESQTEFYRPSRIKCLCPYNLPIQMYDGLSQEFSIKIHSPYTYIAGVRANRMRGLHIFTLAQISQSHGDPRNKEHINSIWWYHL